MYIIKVDGDVFYDPSDPEKMLISPQLRQKVDGAGSLTFTIPPQHPMYDSINKMRSIVTVESDGEEIFRGRALDESTDYYNQREVYCEGEKCFFLDSVVRPYKFEGTAEGFFRHLVAGHNSQVEQHKQFTVGVVTATRAQEAVNLEGSNYEDTLSALQSGILHVFGGYLRTRGENGIRYIDWVQDFDTNDRNRVEFAVNMLDLIHNAKAADAFTVLIPLGEMKEADGGYKPTTINDVNGGLDYIEDAAGIALYGRICKTRTWSKISDPAELKRLGQEYLATYGAATTTLNLTAVDMHFLDGDARSIRIGEHVRILSNPHGIDRTIICAELNIDLQNPENSQYIFGQPPKKLTDNVSAVDEAVHGRGGGGGGGGGAENKIKETKEWSAIIQQDNVSLIQAVSGVVTEQGGLIEQAGLRIDGLQATINLKVSKDGVISSINLSPEAITISAAKVNIEGATVISNLKADVSTLQNMFSAQANFNTATAANLYVTGTFKFQNTWVGFRTVTLDGTTIKYLGTSV